MSLLIPAPRPARIDRNFSGQPSTTWGTTITGTTSHVEGTVTEVIASASDDFDLLVIHCYDMNAAGQTDGLLRVYYGASLNHLIIPDIFCGYAWAHTSGGVGQTTYWPVRLPAGTRVGLSLRSRVASDVVRVMITAIRTGQWCGSKVDAVGVDTSNSRGTAITCTTGVGAWSTLGTAAFNWKAVTALCAGNIDADNDFNNLTMDVGVGSNPIPGGQHFTSMWHPSEIMTGYRQSWRPTSVVSGSTVQGRGRVSTNNEDKYMIAYGIA